LKSKQNDESCVSLFGVLIIVVVLKIISHPEIVCAFIVCPSFCFTAAQRLLLPLHAAIPEASRAETLTTFARPDRSVLQPMVLVSTDRASRGVDFGKHEIN